MESSGFPFLSIDQLSIQLGQFCLFDDPNYMFLITKQKNINMPFAGTILSELIFLEKHGLFRGILQIIMEGYYRTKW